MLKFTQYSIPVLAAGLILTGRTQEDPSAQQKPQSAAGAPAGSQREQQGSPPTQISQQQRNQQSTFQPGQVSDSQLKKSVTEVNKASSFMGMAVKNLQNENLGKINDLVFDPTSGKISYAVVSIGGVLGVGDKLIAVPVTSLKPQPGQKHLVLNMDKNQVQSAPGLAQNNWPDLDAAGLGGAASSESGASSDSSSSTDTSAQPPTPAPSSEPPPSTQIPEPSDSTEAGKPPESSRTDQ